MFLVFLVLFFHTGGEIVKGIRLIALALQGDTKDTAPRPNLFILGLGIGGLAIATIGTAMNFVRKKSDNFVAAVQDVFILLFVLDCDEKVFDMLKYWNPEYANKLFPPTKTERNPQAKDTAVQTETSRIEDGSNTGRTTSIQNK